MTKQKIFNYKFNNDINEFNFFVNSTNFYSFNALINHALNLLIFMDQENQANLFLLKSG